MLEEKIVDTIINTEMRHSIIIEERSRMQITGITEVESFDEQAVLLSTTVGELLIKGMSLHITKIDVQTGNLSLEGKVSDISYGDNAPSGGLLSRLFK